MLFEFQMRKISDIQPFGEEGSYELHWFGLSDGWYWLNFEGDEKGFRYTDAILKHWGATGEDDLPYVDYYAARLWEDVLNMMPYVLDTLPADITERLDPIPEWLVWLERAEAWIEGQDDEDAAWETYLQATAWWHNRTMDTGYLEAAPLINLWRTGPDTIHFRWDANDGELEGITVWACEEYQTTLSLEDYQEEVDVLTHRLIQRMAERVDSVSRKGAGEDVYIDVEELQNEQIGRATWLSQIKAGDTSHLTPDWDEVRRAMTEIEEDAGF